MLFLRLVLEMRLIGDACEMRIPRQAVVLQQLVVGLCEENGVTLNGLVGLTGPDTLFSTERVYDILGMLVKNGQNV